MACICSNGFVMWTPTTEKSLIEEPRSSRSRQIDLTTSVISRSVIPMAFRSSSDKICKQRRTL